MIREPLIALIATFWSCTLLAQDMADTVQLHEVSVIDSVQRQASIQTSYRFDTSQFSGLESANAGQFLQVNTGIFVKNYGPGASSTMTYRGGTAYHTKVYWDGVNIENSMLGQSDGSLLLMGNNLGIEFLKSGHSLALGPGGFGGILNFRPGSTEWAGNHMDIQVEAASFGRKAGHLNFMKGNGKIKFESYLNVNRSDNDFAYVDYVNKGEIKTRENAAQEQIQWIPKLSFLPGKNHELWIASWITESKRQVPSAIGTSHGDALQADHWRKFMLGYRHHAKRSSLEVRTSYMNDALDYQNTLQGIDSRNAVESVKNLINSGIYIGKHWKNEVQAKLDMYKVISNNYSEGIEEYNIGFMESLFYTMDRGYLNGSLRYEEWGEQGSAFMPSFRMAYRPFRQWSECLLYADASYNVRFASFNELYWNDIGNPNLSEEIARSVEGGVRIDGGEHGFIYHTELSLFLSNVSNLILWTPDENGIWKPINRQRVLNSGFEVENKLQWSRGEFDAQFFLNYIYTRSKDLSGESVNDNQQIYVPNHQLNASLECALKGYFIRYRQSVTSLLYVDQANESYIPLSAPAAVSVGKKIAVKKSLFVLTLGLENIFNESYQYVAHMPMPLRNYRASINYIIN